MKGSKLRPFTLALSALIAAAALVPKAATAQRPDLSISDITVLGGARYGKCNDVRVTVRNTQNVPISGAIRVDLREEVPESSGRIATSYLRNGLPPGGTAPLTFRGVPFITLLRAIVDPTDQIRETSDRNNERIITPASQGPCHVISVSDIKGGEGETVRFRITRSGSRNAVVLNYRTLGVRTLDGSSATGGSVCGVQSRSGLPDYMSANRQFLIPAGATSAQVGVTLCKDGTREKSERFALYLSASPEDGVQFQQRRAEGTIIDQSGR